MKKTILLAVLLLFATQAPAGVVETRKPEPWELGEGDIKFLQSFNAHQDTYVLFENLRRERYQCLDKIRAIAPTLYGDDEIFDYHRRVSPINYNEIILPKNRVAIHKHCRSFVEAWWSFEDHCRSLYKEACVTPFFSQQTPDEKERPWKYQ